MKISIQLNQLESLIQSREKKAALDLMRDLLKKHRDHGEVLYRVCDGYRRFGLFAEGFRLLDPERPIRRGISTDSAEGQRLLWSARFLMALGASEYALQIAHFLEPSTRAEDFRALANLYLSDWNPQAALPLFEKMDRLTLDSERNTYSMRLARLGWADAWAGTGDFSRAATLAAAILKGSEEPLLRGICFSALGEYQARAGDFEKAAFFLGKARGFFKEEDRTPDHAVFLKWNAFVLARRGQSDLAAGDFKKAQETLRRPGLRPEGFLDVLRLQKEVGGLDRNWERVIHYPGTPQGFRARLPGQSPTVFGGRLEKTGQVKKREMRIELASEDFQIGRKRYLGLPLEIKLVAQLRIVEDWGLSFLRAKTVLWPDEAFSFIQLEGRLRSLIHRLRAEHGLRVLVQQGQIFLPPSELAKVRVIAGGSEVPRFLRENPGCSASELAGAYGVSDQTAWRWLRDECLSL